MFFFCGEFFGITPAPWDHQAWPRQTIGARLVAQKGPSTGVFVWLQSNVNPRLINPVKTAV